MLVMEVVKSSQVLDVCGGNSQEYFLVYSMSDVKENRTHSSKIAVLHTHFSTSTLFFLSFSSSFCLDKSGQLGVFSETRIHGIKGEFLQFPDGLFLGSLSPEMEWERKRVYA